MIKAIISEYGPKWIANRMLYSVKLKLMTAIPSFEKLFEKRANIDRVDIFNLNISEIKEFLASLPTEKKAEIVSIADNAINGKIKGFSSSELDYGNPVNWHFNPITKAESKKFEKWYRISDFSKELGDIKVIWEASRFTHFYYFSRAYLITGDIVYYKAFSNQLGNWLKENIYSYGANYKCGQECALRMINVLMSYSVFKQSWLISEEDENNVKKLVEVCYRRIQSNFFYAYRCVRNNHVLSEICGLIVGAWCCKDERNLEKAYDLLDKELQRQFLPDGGYIQYSFNYQRFVLQLVECLYKISEKTQKHISEKSRELVRRSAILMYQLQDDSGYMPNYGANDGALVFPVTVCGYRDFRPVISTVYSLATGMRLYDAGAYDEELLWFGNSKARPKESIERYSSAFDNIGLYSLRDSDSYLMVCLQNFKTRPVQMDQLHIDLWYKGKNLFCDSGTYSYSDEVGRSLALTSAHNTVMVNNLEQMDKHGAFLVYNWTKCQEVRHEDCYFYGAMISKNGYEHSRQILRTDVGYEIIDEVISNVGDNYSFFFHTPCGVRIVSGGFELWDEGNKQCTVLAEGVDIEIRRVYRSLYYLIKEEINCIVMNISNVEKCNVKFSIIFNK